ncbi:MAG TPA: isoprenylcysteine carboxylmethyltransferase family protein [Devosiaceae bacterium]|jgi:protein-S-isoprenylcysteine O-methyltransferase Ste14|nr:isoprenylcysteine carboxylmethyltransferase family protein [Devosiaceae bacterium]
MKLLSILVSIAGLFALLFLPAGTLAWPAGWWFYLFMLAALAVATLVVVRANPGIFETRSGFKPGTKGWDLVLVALLAAALVAVPVVAGLDFRWGWSDMPLPLLLLGYPLLLAAIALLSWAQAENRFFELGVRIQGDRGHYVVDSGPYARVRHPGYIASVLLAAGGALALASWWALLPAVLVAVILAYRTLREEETLSAELSGYTHYRRRVRYRWIPGLW